MKEMGQMDHITLSVSPCKEEDFLARYWYSWRYKYPDIAAPILRGLKLRYSGSVCHPSFFTGLSGAGKAE